MRKKFLFFLIIILMSGTFPLFSQSEGTEKVILEELIQEAVGNNPKVLAARDQWKAALERVPQAKALPDPMLSYAHFGQSIETRLGPQRNKLSLSQKFPFFGKLSLKGKIAAQQAAALEERYHQVRTDVVLDVKDSFFTLYWFNDAIRINQAEKDVLKRLAAVARKKYESGTASQQDAIKAQLEISKLSDKMLTLKQGRRSAVAHLNALLNRSPENDFGGIEKQVFPPLEVKLASLYELAEQEQPELKRATQMIAKNEFQLELAKKNYYPDFQLMIDYMDIGGGSTNHPDDGRNAWMGAVGFTIPLWRNKLNAAKAEASIRLEASRETYNGIKNDTFAKITELYHRIKTDEDQIKLYRFSLIPQAEQSFRAAEISYVAGKGDFLSMLESERMLLHLRTGYVRLLTDLGRDLAMLERMVGSVNILKEQGR